VTRAAGWRIALAMGSIVVLGVAARSPGRAERPCRETFSFSPPLYAAGFEGYETPEEAARFGVPLVIGDDLMAAASEEAWAALPLASDGGDGSVFLGDARDAVPDADRGPFQIRVSPTGAGGYAVESGSICLFERPTTS